MSVMDREIHKSRTMPRDIAFGRVWYYVRDASVDLVFNGESSGLTRRISRRWLESMLKDIKLHRPKPRDNKRAKQQQRRTR